jgi:hypothetical protein
LRASSGRASEFRAPALGATGVSGSVGAGTGVATDVGAG